MFDKSIVKSEEEKLKKIDSSLCITRFSGWEGEIRSIGTFFLLKGNADMVKKLERNGWYKTRKEKRDNEYYQYMEKEIRYEKYAIYKTSCGLRAVTYADNVRDIEDYAYISIDSLPVIINDKGGYTGFDAAYEKKNGFIKIVTVLKDTEPLSREEMFPKNSDHFWYGWIDRDGNTYACDFESHYKAAKYICKELGFDSYRPESELEERGWVKISRPAPYTPENLNKRAAYFGGFNVKFEFISKHQADKLIDLGLYEEDKMTRILIKELFNE